MTEEYPHPFSQDEALIRVRALTDYWDRQYGTLTEWDGERARISGRVLGIRFAGRFSVERGRLRGELEAGFLGERLGGRRYVLRKLADYLDPRRSVEELRSKIE